MVEEDRTTNVSISLYKSQIHKVEQFLRHTKKYKSLASFFQFLVDDYFKTSNKGLLKDFMIYLGYPIILMTLMLYVAKSTDDVNQLLINKGFFYSDLTYLSNMFFIIGFLFLGITMTCAYFWYSKYQSDYRSKKTRKVSRARRNR